MRRRSALVPAIVGLVLAFGASAVVAQDDPIGVGDPIPIIDAEGITHGTVQVREVSDPFTGNDLTAPPEEGTRYVALTVTYQAALDQQLDAQPYQILLQDAEGYLYSPVYVPRPADSQIPDLQGQLMAPDDRTSGIITYAVPAEATSDKVVFSPSSDRITDIVDLSPDDAPALGDPVTYTNTAGASTTISAELLDPFTEYDPAYPPAEGTRFVLVRPVFENTGQVPYYADSYDVYLRDGSGRLIGPTTVYRPAEVTVANLETQTMSPGDRVSGYVGFQVPADNPLADVLYYPETGRIVPIAHLDGEAAPAGDQPADEAPASPPA